MRNQAFTTELPDRSCLKMLSVGRANRGNDFLSTLLRRRYSIWPDYISLNILHEFPSAALDFLDVATTMPSEICKAEEGSEYKASLTDDNAADGNLGKSFGEM